MASSSAAATSEKVVNDKRGALLDAALELFAGNGLHGVSTSAIARMAGVAKGTLFVYFETKELLLNELYLEVANRYVEAMRAAADEAMRDAADYAVRAATHEAATDEATRAAADAPAAGESALKPFWFALARWNLDHSDAATFMLQCEVSSVLSPETQARKSKMEEEMARAFFPELDERFEDPLLRYVAYALIAGPIQVLAQVRDKGEVEITDALLEQTYARVEKALMP